VGSDPRDGRHRFATTRWSLVLAAGRGDSVDAAAALAALCEAYWFPVYAFVRRSGHSDDEARDLTQAFFARMLDTHGIETADPVRGRFRSFLLASVRHFLLNHRDAASSLKRGGGVPHLTLEFDDGERQYSREPGHHDTPERLYERRWALATLTAAIARVRHEYHASGRGPLFDALQPFLDGGEPASYRELAAILGSSDGALRVAAHRLRRAFRTSLREVVESTVEGQENVEDELRYLLSVVARD
jgi:RNA polymerase sigma-70 factor (ECF subfamily)